MRRTTPKKSPPEEDDPPGRSEPEGLPGPDLSAPAALPRRRNWIRQSKTVTRRDHYRQPRRGETEECLAHLTLPRFPPLQEKEVPLRLEKCKRNTFPSGGLAAISQNIHSLHTPAKGILSTATVQPPPPSSSCWRYSRWPCHSRPCVPSGIRSCPQQAVPRSPQLLAVSLHHADPTPDGTFSHHGCASHRKTHIHE